jgi:elongation factor G
MGELHLQVALERLQREFHQEIRVGTPTVVVRETIARPAPGETLFQRTLEPQGNGQTLQARAQVRVIPLARGGGVRIFCHPTVLPEGASLNPLQDEALAAGVDDAIASGPLEGAPLQDLEVRVETVELFGAASTPQALRITVASATRKAISQAGGLLLQPLMHTEITAPEEQVGAVLGDLQARHGVILSTEALGDTLIIKCLCPLVNLLGYITQLRSLTQGRGQFTMYLARFDVV